MGVSGELGGSHRVVMQRPDVALALIRLDAGEAPHRPLADTARSSALSVTLRAGPGGCNGGWEIPLAKMVLYYNTHLAVSVKEAIEPTLAGAEAGAMHTIACASGHGIRNLRTVIATG